MAEFITPFFFTYNDDLVGIHELACNSFAIKPYNLFCLYNEVVYWLQHHTTFKDGKLRMEVGPKPKPTVYYGSKYLDYKLYVTLKVEPDVDDEVKSKLQHFIDATALLKDNPPCLLLASDISIDNMDQQWVADALEIVSCDLGTTRSDTAEANERIIVPHFTVKDQWSTRLYVLLDGDNDATLLQDSRNFNERYHYLLITVKEQLREMWKYGLVKGASIIAEKWPLIDVGKGWYRAKEGTILPRCMSPPCTFYTNIISGSNIVRFRVPHNYAVYYHIAAELNRLLYHYRFSASHLEVVIADYKQCVEVNTIVEDALRTHSKVISIVHPKVELTNYTIASINGEVVALIPIANHEIGYLKQEMIMKELDNIIVEVKK